MEKPHTTVIAPAKQTRASRTSRPETTRTFRVNEERDYDILEMVAKCPFAATRHIAKLFFTSRSGANKRLTTLKNANYLRAWERTKAEENYYTITRNGLRALSDVDIELHNVTIPRKLDGNLDHTSAINDVRVALALSLPDVQAELVPDAWHSEWMLRKRHTSGLIPDARFMIDWPEGEAQMYFLEVEWATQSPQNFLKKMLDYAAQLGSTYGLFGYHDVTVLTVIRDSDRLEQYRRRCTSLAQHDWIWFTAFDDLVQDSMGPIWVPITDAPPRSLNPGHPRLTTIPIRIKRQAESPIRISTPSLREPLSPSVQTGLQ